MGTPSTEKGWFLIVRHAFQIIYYTKFEMFMDREFWNGFVCF